jgi:hypothetical protein
MKIMVATLVAFLIGITVVSSEAEARCWWNGYNHCPFYHPRYYHAVAALRQLAQVWR